MTDAAPPTPATPPGSCPRCDAQGLEAGYLVDTNGSGRFDMQWATGEPREALFGGVKASRDAWSVAGLRCTGCGRLELFATTPTTPR
ncbi:hypothetical protein [Agrococcus jejuensis]|uniref:Uncharacterized protein n=1 Tax=Agrococcus jejuensis TaxID=399736 RepID=A0A1G8F546_9MICO|nr:hypothetical protein [Agrococcus jejuensis]SDH77234.1 hypothetical protein SAMN04489720_2334 [Agrococcus jejuensis]